MPSNVIQFTIKGHTEGAIKAMEKMRASLAKIAAVSAIVGTALIAAFTTTLKSIINVGSKVENLKIRLNALLGSAYEGGRAFDEMAKFAATVPFSFDAIMESATTLAGVVTGGVDEISQWMPVIADLATVSGLSIQDTTSQVQRMLAGGANAADMFRERGITAMLGFQAGVSVSAEETKKRLIAAFEDPASKFAGASKKMATTWDGVLSMIGDKWFTLKKNISDEGIFNYIKAVAIAFDQWFGGALKESGDTAKRFSDFMIESLRSMMEGVGILADMFQGLRAVWAGLQVIFSMFATGMYENILKVGNAIRSVANAIPGIDISNFETLELIVKESRNRTSELKEELNELVTSGMPSEKIKEFGTSVETVFEKLQEASRATGELLTETVAAAIEVASDEMIAFQEQITEKFLLLNESLLTEREREKISYQQKLMDLDNFYTTSNMLDKDYRKAKEKLNEQHQKNLATTNKKAILGSYEFGAAIRNLEFSDAIGHASDMINNISATGKAAFRIQKAASLAKAVVSLPSAVVQSYENGGGWPWGLIPAGIMLTTGLAQISKINSTSYGGAAHGGMTNIPRESTYLLQKGERVLSPNQNKDFTSFIGTNGSTSSGRGGVRIDNLIVHVLENAINADAILEMDRTQIEEFVAGPIIDAMDSLDAQGTKPNWARRSDA